MKTISVITPAYNAEKYIQQTIRSIKESLTFGEFEIEHVIVDDFSTDSTRKIIENERHSKMKTIYLSQNSGQANARNIGVSNSHGDLLFMLDDDDLVTQSGLLYLFKTIEESQENWTYGDSLSIDDSSKYLLGKDYNGWNFKNREELLTSMFTGDHVFLPNSMFSKSKFEQVGGYNISLRRHEVPDLFIRFLLQKYVPKWSNTVTILRRIHGQNASINNIRDSKTRKNAIKESYIVYKNELCMLLSGSAINKIETYLKLR